MSLVLLKLRQLHCLWPPLPLPHGTLHPTVLWSLNSFPPTSLSVTLLQCLIISLYRNESSQKSTITSIDTCKMNIYCKLYCSAEMLKTRMKNELQVSLKILILLTYHDMQLQINFLP